MSADAGCIAFTCPECRRKYGKTGRSIMGMATCCAEQSVRRIAALEAELALVRRAFDGEQEAMRKNVADTVRAGAERDAAIARELAAQAEAAAMRNWMIVEMPDGSYECQQCARTGSTRDVEHHPKCSCAGSAGAAIAEVVKEAQRFVERTSEIDEKHPAYGFVVMGIPLARALAKIKSPADQPCNCMQNDSDSMADHGGVCPQHGKTRRP